MNLSTPDYFFVIQIDIGILAACFTVVEDMRQKTFCIVQVFEYMDTFGIQVYNEYDCPILSLSNLFCCVPSTSINHSVSVVHECSSSCVFRRISTTTTVEREKVQACKLCFVHDFSNSMYALNVYCMH